MGLRRSWLPVVLAAATALAIIPLVPGLAAADSYLTANCSALLRKAASTSSTALVSMPPGTIVTVTGTVSGTSWSASCPSSVSGSTWYQITAVNGQSVQSRFGFAVAYSAAGLFVPSATPPPPPSDHLLGLDVSYYDGAIDWAAVAGAGKRFVIMRATLGETYADPTYATNHAGARAAGMLVGAYHYAKPSSDPNDAVIQADWYANNAALLPGDLVPALDLEETGGLGTSDLQAWVAAWLGEVSTKLGVRPMIYTSPNFWATAMGGTTMFADGGYSVLWVAHWGITSPTVPGGSWSGNGWTFWQYTSDGAVAGHSGRTDLDEFNGTDLTPLTYAYTYVPPPPPAAGPPALDTVAPAVAPAGGPDLTVTLSGSGFVSGVSSAFWNGSALATTYVSPDQLTAVVPAALTAAPGTASIAVANGPTGEVSTALPFTVTVPPAQLSIAPSAGVITWGQPVTLTASFAQAGTGRPVRIERMQANEAAWSTVATLTADATGTASFTATPPVNTQYRAVFDGAPDLGAATSPAVRVVVRQTLVLRPAPGPTRAVRAGTRVAFTATVRPIGSIAPPRVTFAVWHLVGGRWQRVTMRTVGADASGRATLAWTFTARGSWYVRAMATPTTVNANSAWSALDRYSVY